MAKIPVTGPKMEDGPVIDGMLTRVSTYSARQLQDSPLLPSLFKLVNLAYLLSDQESFGSSTGDRLKSIKDLIFVLNDDPESFIINLSYPHEPDEVLGTATCRRYYGPDADTTKPWACTHTPHPETDEWETKMVATQPSLQGKGLASYMLKAVEREVMSRSRTKTVAGEDAKLSKMIICTPTYAAFYARRGYRKDYSRSFRNEDMAFDILFMSKMLEGPSVALAEE